MKTTYLKKVISQFPQLLSRLDQDPYSPTFGCFDRLYWGWKLKDFADATLQRAVYTIALLWQEQDCIYYNNDLLPKLVSAGINYWCNIQHKNGSVDQAFPFEQSYGASAFTLYPLLQAYQIIRKKLTRLENEKYEEHFKRCSAFLCKTDEEHGTISNHLAGAALALKYSSQIFKSERYSAKAKRLIDRIIKFQSDEGWFIEYEGFDAGYQTLATYYLAQYWQLNRDEKLLTSINKSVQFLSYFFHTDGILGGEYGSRNTELYFPAGFEILRSHLPISANIADRMYENIEANSIIPLSSLDEGNLFPMMSNYMIAHIFRIKNGQQDLKSEQLPYKKEIFTKNFGDAGIFLKNCKHYYLILGVSKGGVIKIYDYKKNKWVLNDAGYIGKLISNDIVSSQIYGKSKVRYQNNDTIIIEIPFFNVLNAHPSPQNFLILRLLNLSFMRNVWIGNLVKQRLVKLLISGKKSYPITLARTIKIKDSKIIIEDEVKKSKKYNFKWLHYGIPFSTIHMASSKYFQMGKLINYEPNNINVEILNKANMISRKTIFKFG